jgi:polysaccharide export outer membrane protein
MVRQRAGRLLSVWGSRVLALTIGACLGVGCAAGPQGPVGLPPTAPTSPPSAVTEINNALTASAALQTPAASPDYRIGADDLLQITLFNIPQGEVGVTPRTTEARVSQEGMISLPLLGDVTVAGLTTSGLEQLLRGRYDRYLHNPQVGVQVKEYRSQVVTVSGAVRSPIVYQLTGPKTLIDMLAIAGGVSERAGSQVHLYRQSPEGRQSYVVDLLALANNPGMVNMAVQGGDVVNVPQAGMFYVDGAVRNPGSYALSRPYTITQALAVAGGVNRELAAYNGTTIYRRRNGVDTELIPVELTAIWDGKANDVVINADDVIIVPISTPKFIVRRFIGTIGLGSVPGYVP